MIQTLIDFSSQLIEYVVHMDFYLNQWITAFGVWFYVLMFLVIFCETGVVVMPFLPGDSLLFALGALCAVDNAYLDVKILGTVLFVAAVLGDFTNYYIGRKFGPSIFKSETSKWLNKSHILKTQKFFERHGGKTIIFARFAPIVRTFAPFVAGIGNMDFNKFASYNVFGGLFWVWSFLLAGFYFGNLPAIKDNFHIVIFAIVIVSLMPAIIEFVKAKRAPSVSNP